MASPGNDDVDVDVVLAAMVSVVPACVKSAAVAGLISTVDTVSVTASLDGPDRVAVTMLTPPSSAIAAGSRTSAASGFRSSSISFSVTVLDGCATALSPLAALAEIVTDLFGA